SSLSCHCSIRNLQPAVDDRKHLAHLRLRDAQRRVREERVPPHERVQAFLPEKLAERCHLLRRAIEGRQGRPLCAITDELDEPEETDRPRGPDRWMPPRQLVH